MHVRMLVRSEEGIVALDAAALHVFVPAGRIVGFHQGGLTLPGGVELDLLYGVLQHRANGNHCQRTIHSTF